MNLRDLRYLVAVADHHHFGRAAEACFVSQPTLSTQIKKLEAELGVELIERTPRQALLTAPGERVVERARIVLAEADSIRRIAQQANDPESGTVRMGLFPTIAPYVLPHVVETCARSSRNSNSSSSRKRPRSSSSACAKGTSTSVCWRCRSLISGF